MTVHVRQAGSLPDGRDLSVIEISNPVMTARFLDLGASLWQLIPSRAQNSLAHSICLHHPDPAAYAHNPPYLGCTVGPVANRIANSRFELSGRTHRLAPNEGPHHLHGGPTGFGHRQWAFDTDPASDSVTFRLNRAGGDGGYPGTLDLGVTWILDGGDLRFEWTASSDEPTPVSLANHTYWNLTGTGTIENHQLQVESTEIVEVDNHLIPTGRLLPVDNTSFDLREGPRLAEVIGQVGGIDHCYVLEPGSRTQLIDPASGLSLRMETTLPGLQVYTGHLLDGSAAQGGYGPRSGVCLETQFFPDATNNSQFPSPVLEPGKEVHHRTTYSLHQADPADRST